MLYGVGQWTSVLTHIVIGIVRDFAGSLQFDVQRASPSASTSWLDALEEPWLL